MEQDPMSPGFEQKQVRVKRKTLQTVLEQCQKALELLKNTDLEKIDEDEVMEGEEEVEREEGSSQSSVADDAEADQLCDILKSRVESSDFLVKLGSIHLSASRNFSVEGNTCWDMVSATDLWDEENMDGQSESDKDGFILVSQEDIVDGIASFMAAYLLSLKQTKDLNPNQLQDALSKIFSAKKERGKVRKAWDGSIVVYNVASWGATAVRIYQNPALLKAASSAFWTSCRFISKLF